MQSQNYIYIDIIPFNPFCLSVCHLENGKAYKTDEKWKKNFEIIDFESSTFWVIDMAFRLQLIYAFHFVKIDLAFWIMWLFLVFFVYTAVPFEWTTHFLGEWV